MSFPDFQQKLAATLTLAFTERGDLFSTCRLLTLLFYIWPKGALLLWGVLSTIIYIFTGINITAGVDWWTEVIFLEG